MYGEILCNREVQLNHWSFYLYHFIATNFRIWYNVSLHALAGGCTTCNCHLLASRVSVLSHTPCKCHELVTCMIILTDWSYKLGKFASQQWSCLSDNWGKNPSLQLTRLWLSSMVTIEHLLDFYMPRNLHLHSIRLCFYAVYNTTGKWG